MHFNNGALVGGVQLAYCNSRAPGAINDDFFSSILFQKLNAGHIFPSAERMIYLICQPEFYPWQKIIISPLHYKIHSTREGKIIISDQLSHFDFVCFKRIDLWQDIGLKCEIVVILKVVGQVLQRRCQITIEQQWTLLLGPC